MLWIIIRGFKLVVNSELVCKLFPTYENVLGKEHRHTSKRNVGIPRSFYKCNNNFQRKYRSRQGFPDTSNRVVDGNIETLPYAGPNWTHDCGRTTWTLPSCLSRWLRSSQGVKAIVSCHSIQVEWPIIGLSLCLSNDGLIVFYRHFLRKCAEESGITLKSACFTMTWSTTMFQ